MDREQNPQTTDQDKLVEECLQGLAKPLQSRAQLEYAIPIIRRGERADCLRKQPVTNRIFSRHDLEEARKAVAEEIKKDVVKMFASLVEFAEHGDYSNGNEAFGSDEGRFMAYRRLAEIQTEWRTFWERFK